MLSFTIIIIERWVKKPVEQDQFMMNRMMLDNKSRSPSIPPL